MKVELHGPEADSARREFETGDYSATLILNDGRHLTIWGNGMFTVIEPVAGAHHSKWRGSGRDILADLGYPGVPTNG